MQTAVKKLHTLQARATTTVDGPVHLPVSDPPFGPEHLW